MAKDDVEPQFQDESPEEIVFTDEAAATPDPDEDLPEDVKKSSKKDLYNKVKALEEKAAAAPGVEDRIAGSFAKAVEGLRPAPAAAAPAPARESDADFMGRLKKDLFDEEKAPALLKELVAREVGPMFAQTVEINFAQARRLAEMDAETGPVLKRYGKEVDAMLGTLPDNVRKTPQALDYVLKQVRSAHISDIAREMAQTMLEEERARTDKPRRETLNLEAGGARGGSVSSAAPRKKIITITQEDRRKADEMGVDASVVAAQRAGRVS
jgi:hypothetical protein